MTAALVGGGVNSAIDHAFMSAFHTKISSPARYSPDARPRSLLLHAERIGRAHAELSRMLGRGLHLALPDPSLDLLLLPQSDAMPPSLAPEESGWLALGTATGVVHVEDGERFLAALTGIDGGSEAGDQPHSGNQAWPQWLTGAVAGRLRGTLLASLRTVTAVAALPLYGVEDAVMLQLRLHDQDHALSFMASALPQVWLALLAGAGAPTVTAPLRMPLSDWLPLTLSFPVSLARHRLPLAACGELAGGDLILPAQGYFDIAGEGRLRLGGRHWKVRLVAPQRLQLLNEENRMDTDMMDDEALDDATDRSVDDADNDGAEDESPSRRLAQAAERDEDHTDDNDDASGSSGLAGALALTLRFELGRLRLTLDQLRALGPGSVLEVQDGSPQSIAIACGGAQVGHGEVVDVDGRLGVRITHWSGAC